MKTTDNTIILKSDISINSMEADFEMYEDILGKEKVDAAYEDSGVDTIYEGKYGQHLENMPIKIENLKKMLLELEKSGCNYVSIDYNCDNLDYTFYGVDVHAATESEIDKINNKEKEVELKRLEVESKKLQDSLAAVRNKIEKIK